MPRKQRFDSIAGEGAAFRAAALKIEPPKHCRLKTGAEDFYNAIIDSRDPQAWNTVDLARAVTLANYQLMIRDNSALLEKEGEVIENERGTPVMNPRFNIVNTLTRLEISLSKALQTDAASTQGEGREVRKRNEKAKEIKSRLNSITDDSLIPGITVQ